MEIKINPSFETVIVTYSKDFNKLQQCLQSIIDTGLGHNNEPIHIVVNDHESTINEITNFIPNDSRIRVWHYKDLDDWSGPLDWYSQQWFKLSASKIVSSEWYLLLDSDNTLQMPIGYDDMFSNNRAHYRLMFIDFTNKELLERLAVAYDHWDDTLDNWKYFMTDQIPFIMHTNTVKQMLPQVNSSFFDSRSNKITLEFLLWSAYLDHCGIKDQLYCPVKNSSQPMFNVKIN